MEEGGGGEGVPEEVAGGDGGGGAGLSLLRRLSRPSVFALLLGLIRLPGPLGLLALFLLRFLIRSPVLPPPLPPPPGSGLRTAASWPVQPGRGLCSRGLTWLLAGS